MCCVALWSLYSSKVYIHELQVRVVRCDHFVSLREKLNKDVFSHSRRMTRPTVPSGTKLRSLKINAGFYLFLLKVINVQGEFQSFYGGPKLLNSKINI